MGTPTPRSHLPKRIIIVRHGESEGNLDTKAYSVIPDHKIPLTLRGADQARQLGNSIRQLVSASDDEDQATGCSLTVLPGRKKWVKPSVAKNMACADEFFARKRAATAAAAGDASNDQPSA